MESNEKTNKERKQRFIIIILLIIIIILLSYLSYILGKIGNTPTSSSQVSGDIFEVVVGEGEEEQQNNNETNIENEIADTSTEEGNTSSNNINNKKTNLKIINYSANTTDNNSNNQENNNQENSNNNTNNESNNNNNNNNNNEDNNNTNDNNDEQNKDIEVSDENQTFGKGQQINIFKHTSKNVKNDKIAPLTKSTYRFDIKNGNKFAIKYQIKMSEENPYNINMKYRLKLDGKYIIGDENTWVNINEINTNNLILANESYAKFELDWYWAEGENDTFIGTQIQSKYKVYMEIYAEER